MKKKITIHIYIYFPDFEDIDLFLELRVCLVHCNGYYTVIEISITRNKISCNKISITIHQFGTNT